ncbi:MAG: hypothetical protein ABIN83_05295, partial [Sphingomicrobium sp.]
EPRLRGMARMQMAAHYCVLSVYHFQSTLRSIRHCLGQCPALEKFVDVKVLVAAIARFDNDFPDFKMVRDAVGHYADRLYKPANIAARHHADGEAFTHGTLMGRKLTFTDDGRYISLEVSGESLEKLALIQFDCFEAFQKACGPRPKG